MPDGSRRVAGSTESTRGCKHLCRHCPIVPVYNGLFSAVPLDLVLADVRSQIEAGAQHITFGDADFFNGPTRIGWQARDDSTAVEVAFLCALTRRPSPEIAERLEAQLRGTTGDERSARMEDVYWSLLNSTEFKWNH